VKLTELLFKTAVLLAIVAGAAMLFLGLRHLVLSLASISALT
jgi:hypothetical protein